MRSLRSSTRVGAAALVLTLVACRGGAAEPPPSVAVSIDADAGRAVSPDPGFTDAAAPEASVPSMIAVEATQAAPAPSASTSAPETTVLPESLGAPSGCNRLIETIHDDGLRRNQITVLTPHPDETTATLEDRTVATLARLSPGDPHLRKLVGSYRDALHACAVVTHAVARAIESGQTPSMATQRALYKATQASDQAAGAIEDYCTVHAPPR